MMTDPSSQPHPARMLKNAEKLLVIVVTHGEGQALREALIAAGFEVTIFSSTGAFFRRENLTLLVGLKAERLDSALSLVREKFATPPDDDEHRATLFVLDTTQIVAV